MAKSDVMFRITADNMDALYSAFSDDVVEFIRRERALGIGDDEIFNRLQDNLNNGQDFFGRFKGAMEVELDNIVGVTAQDYSNSIYAPDAMLKWELDPTVVNHCEDCLRNAKDAPRTYQQWEAIGIPGFGNTACSDYCKCTLVRV